MMGKFRLKSKASRTRAPVRLAKLDTVPRVFRALEQLVEAYPALLMLHASHQTP